MSTLLKLDLKRWSLQEQLDQEKSKLSLQTREYRAASQICQVQVDANHSRISKLQQECKEKRKFLASQSEKIVVNTALVDRRQDRLSLQNLPFSEVLEMAENRASGKYLDALIDEKTKKELMLYRLERDYELNEHFISSGFAKKSEERGLQVIRTLENNLEKSKLKFLASAKIKKHYQDIISTLEEERLGLPGKLAMLESFLNQQRDSVDDIKATALGVRAQIKEGESSLASKREEIEKLKLAREKTLVQIKKSLDQQKIASLESYQRFGRVSILGGEDQISRSNSFSAGLIEELNNYQRSLKKIKDAAKISDLSKLPNRLKSEDEVIARLRNQMEEAEAKQVNLKNFKENLQRQLDISRYGNQDLAVTASLESVFQNSQSKVKELAEITQKFNYRNHRLTVLQSNIEALKKKLEKFLGIKINPKSNESGAESVSLMPEEEMIKEKTLSCILSIEILLGPLLKKEKMTDNCEQIITYPEFFDMLEIGLPPQNRRVSLSNSSVNQQDAHELVGASSDEEDDGRATNIPTREGLKKRADEMIREKTSKKSSRRAPAKKAPKTPNNSNN